MTTVLPAVLYPLLVALPQGPPPNGESFALFQGLYARERIELRVPSGPCERAAARLAEALNAAGRFEAAVVVEGAPEPDPEAVRCLVGAPDDPALRPLVDALGVEVLTGGFRVLGRDHLAPGDALSAVFEDPLASGRPLWLVLGNDLEDVAVYLDHVPRLSRPELRVFAEGDPSLVCPLELDGTPRESGLVDYAARRARYFAGGETHEAEGLVVHARTLPPAQRWRRYARDLAGVRRRLDLWLGAGSPEVRPAEEAAEQPGPRRPRARGAGADAAASPAGADEPVPGAEGPAGSTQEEGTGTDPAAIDEGTEDASAPEASQEAPQEAQEVPPGEEAAAPEDPAPPPAPELPTVEVFLYEHLEDFEQCLGREALSVTNRLRPRVHVLLQPDMPDDAGAAVALVLAWSLAGEPEAPWIEDGLAAAATGRWWRRPLDEWIAHLAAANLVPGVDEVVEADAARTLSEHCLVPARGLLFTCLVEDLGTTSGRLKALWKGGRENEQRVYAAYRKAIVSARKDTDGPRARLAARRRARGGDAAQRLARLPFRHGLALLPGESGYGARAVAAALDEAAALGAGPDALSLTVLAAGEEPDPPLCRLDVRPAYGSQSDLALASAAAAAAGREMGVLLSLELLARPNGAWADNISWTLPESPTLFWERYQRVATHYALLAELLPAELLSVGGNLRQTTRSDPGPKADRDVIAERRAGWRNLTRVARAAFGGGVSYCASFPQEALETDLYEHLDFVGLSLFPTFEQDDVEPGPEELLRDVRFALKQSIDLAARWNKPLLVLQTGFPARAGSWSWPHVPRGERDDSAQRRYVEAFADALEGPLANREMMRGFYLWSWSVDEPVEGEPAGFGLRRQPVDDVLERLFAR